MDKPLASIVNGVASTTIAIADRGLQFGDGLFETLAVRAGEPLLWDAHMQRLRVGAARLNIDLVAPEQLRDEIDALCRGHERAVLKLIVTRGSSGRGYRALANTPTRIATLWPWPDYRTQRMGIDLTVCKTPLCDNPQLAGIKHLNRLEQVLARAEWGDEFAEGVMCDTHGNAICGTMSNLFVVANGRIATPALNRCGIRGIMRDAILGCASDIGVAHEERALSLQEVSAAQEVFVSNSLIGIWPVKTFQQRRWGIGEITAALQRQIAHKRYAIGET